MPGIYTRHGVPSEILSFRSKLQQVGSGAQRTTTIPYWAVKILLFIYLGAPHSSHYVTKCGSFSDA